MSKLVNLREADEVVVVGMDGVTGGRPEGPARGASGSRRIESQKKKCPQVHPAEGDTPSQPIYKATHPLDHTPDNFSQPSTKSNMASRRLVPCLWRPLSLTGETAKGGRGWPAAWAPPSSSRTAASVGAAVTHPLLRPGAPAPALSTTHARHFTSKTNPSFAARPALVEEETVEATEDEKVR